MKKNLIRIAAFIGFLAIVYIYAFDPFIELVLDTPTGMSDFRDEGSYEIDPNTILSSLNQGNTNVFLDTSMPPTNPSFEESIAWRQADFTQVAGALQRHVWGETLNNWSLYYMRFSTPCQDNPQGFGFSEFYYFRTIFDNYGKIKYTARGLQLAPQYRSVTWGGRINFPRTLFGWKSVDLENIKITGEEALNVAETHGGRIARLSVQNNCEINVGISGYSDWDVTIYEVKTGSQIFKAKIDPYSGKPE